MQEIASPATLKAAVEHLSSADPILASIIAESGPATIVPHKKYYPELVENIVSQQLSVKAAATIFKCFRELFPGSEFPSPEKILTKDIEEFRAVGLSRQKATYIQDLAYKVIEGEVQFDHLDALSNEEVITELTKIKGVGVWTVHMFLMFCMGRLNVLPTGDLGIKNGIHRLYDLAEKPTPEQMEEIALKNNWHPYRTIASWYIWRSLDNMPQL